METTKPKKARAEVIFKPDLCKGCGLCIHMCPEQCLVRAPGLNRMGYRPAEYKGDGCTGCLSCFHTCPEPDAIAIHRFR